VILFLIGWSLRSGKTLRAREFSLPRFLSHRSIRSWEDMLGYRKPWTLRVGCQLTGKCGHAVGATPPQAKQRGLLAHATIHAKEESRRSAPTAQVVAKSPKRKRRCRMERHVRVLLADDQAPPVKVCTHCWLPGQRSRWWVRHKPIATSEGA